MYELFVSVASWLSVAVLLLALLILSIAVLFWLQNWYVSKHLYKNVYTMKTTPILSFWNWFLMYQRQKSKRVFVLRIMASLCKSFYTERLFMLWIGFRPLILFYKADVIEPLLNNSKTISKSEEYRFLKPWLGTGLLTSTGEKWRRHRKLLTPTFHYQILDHFLVTFNEEASVLTEKLDSEVGKPWFDIVPKITMCTLDTICQTAMGVHLEIQSGGGKEYLERIDDMNDIVIHRMFRPWLWPDFMFYYCSSKGRKFYKNVKALQDFTRKVIKEKKESMQKENCKRMDDETHSGRRKRKAFLELLLELHLSDNSLTEEDIREEVDTFLFEGHDTTAISISMTLYELGQHLDVQEKVYQELENILGSDKTREFTSEDLKQMKYLECTIKESLRLYPSVSFIARQLTENLKIDNLNLAPGCSCFVCIFMLHMDPEQFPCPEVFDPDRFLPENSHKRHPYAYIPFSAGPRNCIGQKFAMMEEKIILAHLLRKFKIISLDPRDKIEMQIGIIVKNADPIRIRLELRDNGNDLQYADYINSDT